MENPAPLARSTAIDGFYAGFFTAAGGNGLALFIFSSGSITGADATAVQFDGAYSEKEGIYEGSVSVKVPPGVTIIQGVTAPSQGLMYDVPLSMPLNFLEGPYLRLETPFGAVNINLVKLRELT